MINDSESSKKRILVYGMIGNNSGGGVDKYLIRMSRFMNETVFDYVIEGNTCDWEEEIYRLESKIYYIAYKNDNPLKNIRDNWRLLSRLRTSHEVAYFNLGSLSWLTPIIIAKVLGYRVYTHSHMSKMVLSDLHHRAIYAINKRLLKMFKIKRMACSETAADYMYYPGDEVDIINNAVDTERFEFNPTVRERKRSELSIGDAKVIGFVGRLVEQKNPLFLPDILKSALDYDLKCKLMVIGNGDKCELLKEKLAEYKIADKCMLMGNVENVHELLQAMDVFVLPSFHEGLPFSLIEAQASGLQCIASDRITKESNVTGEVSFISLEDSDAWGKAIYKALNDNECDRERVSAYMKDSSFNIRNEAVRLEQLLRQE